MSKHVRFAKDLERTPSPSYSPSSATSSPLLHTPPMHSVPLPRVQMLSPTSSNTSPSLSRRSVHSRTPSPSSQGDVHAVLSSVSYKETLYKAAMAGPPLKWNVTRDPQSLLAAPSTRMRSPVPYTLTHETFLQSAIFPTERNITIVCEKLPWKIDVSASNNEFITIEDVLTAIYRTLRIQASPAEVEKACNSQRDIHERLFRALRARCEAAPDAMKQRENQKGMRRVDFLLESTTFAGLSPTAKPHQFELHMK